MVVREAADQGDRVPMTIADELLSSNLPSKYDMALAKNSCTLFPPDARVGRLAES